MAAYWNIVEARRTANPLLGVLLDASPCKRTSSVVRLSARQPNPSFYTKSASVLESCLYGKDSTLFFVQAIQCVHFGATTAYNSGILPAYSPPPPRSGASVDSFLSRLLLLILPPANYSNLVPPYTRRLYSKCFSFFYSKGVPVGTCRPRQHHTSTPGWLCAVESHQ